MPRINATCRYGILSCVVFASCLLISDNALGSAKKSKGHAYVSIVVSKQSVILIGRAALPLFSQCSRMEPMHVTGYWTPTKADIRQLEKDLLPFEESQTLPKFVSLTDEYRQYAGFVQNGHKMIYVNGFELVYAIEDEKSKDAWKYKAMGACDGGPTFYGVEYDLTAHRFQNLSFNGDA